MDHRKHAARSRERMKGYAGGGMVSDRPSDAQLFGPENEPGPTDNPRDYSRNPASLSEKVVGAAKVYGQLGSDFVDRAKKALK